MSRTPDPQWLYLVVGYVAGYVFLDWVSFIHPIPPYAITPWNPQVGLSLALLLAKGLRYAPGVLLAVSIGEYGVHGGGERPWLSLLFATVLAAGYTCVAFILLRVVRFDPRFQSLRDLALFIVVVGVGAVVIAGMYVAAHVVAGDEPWSELVGHTMRLWVSDFIGVIVITPFLLVRAVPRPRALVAGAWTEVVLQGAAILLAVSVIFSLEGAVASKFFYVLFLPLIWIAMRHGFEGAAAALLATQVALFVAVQLAGYAAAWVFDFQLLMLALVVTGLFLGMAASESRRAQRALQAREAELKTVFETAPDAIVTADAAGRVVAVNPAGERLFGSASDRLAGAPFADLVPLPAGRERVSAMQVQARRADGAGFSAEVSLAPTDTGGRVSLIAVLRDVSERVAMENRLRERESELDRVVRAAAAAELASALAHELNQPLTAAANYVHVCELLLERMQSPPEKLAVALGRAVSEVERASEVVRRLREFYRGAGTRRESVSPASVVESTLRVASPRLQRYGIDARVELEAALPLTSVDRIEIEIVLHNLIANAVDAIESAGASERRIDIRARRGEPGFVEIVVEDSGPGVAPEIAQRLFTTFCSSKPSGMGLGLAISRSIIEAHGGRLWLDRARPGARFVMALPVTGEDAAA